MTITLTADQAITELERHPVSAHKFQPEATNAGHYFADCSCGWTGGVHLGRGRAREAWLRHRDGRERLQPGQPQLLIAPPSEVSR